MSAQDPDVLKYYGALGYTYVVVSDDGKGGRRCRLESCDRMGAMAAAMGEFSDANATLYHQFCRGKWKRVYGAAR